MLRELSRGGTYRQMATALCVSEETIKTHVGSILAKLQVSNRGQAVVRALKKGLVGVEEL